jgi:hypothetical protein
MVGCRRGVQRAALPSGAHSVRAEQPSGLAREHAGQRSTRRAWDQHIDVVVRALPRRIHRPIATPLRWRKPVLGVRTELRQKIFALLWATACDVGRLALIAGLIGSPPGSSEPGRAG